MIRPTKRNRARSALVRAEALEDRRVPATFAVVDAGDAGPGTLRQAILDANATPGADVVAFAIPGEGVRTIRPFAPLPTITDALAIDGYSQPGSRPDGFAIGDDARLLIELDGSGGGSGSGLVIRADDSSVRGLVINRFSEGVGIGIGGPLRGEFSEGTGPTRVAIAGNRIGVDATGALALGNGAGIGISRASDVTIGGASPGEGNVISANIGPGISIGKDTSANFSDFGEGATARFSIVGNLIGVDATGAVALGNGGHGVRLRGVPDVTFDGNVISANGGSGILIEPSQFVTGRGVIFYSERNGPYRISRNAIGVDRERARALGNAGDGITLIGTTGAEIGDRADGAPNVISANRGSGIRLAEVANQNAILDFREVEFTTNTSIEFTRIGTDSSGAADLGNGLDGIRIEDAVRTSTAGVRGGGNLIRFNRGLAISSPPSTTNFDGSTQSNPAVYLPAAGAFAYRRVDFGHANVVVPFGLAGPGQTIPALGDYDGDGIGDFGAYLPALGAYAFRGSNARPDELFAFGLPGPGQSIPAAADYDGDGRDDVAVYLPALGAFGVRPSGGGGDALFAFGLPGAGQSLPAPGDYDGDGRDDAAVYLPALGAFGIRFSGGDGDAIIPFGLPGPGLSIPATGDYDGDGRADLAVYLAPFGAFAYRPSGGGADQIIPFGTPGDGSIPVPGDYTSSERTEVAIFNPNFGVFAYRPAGGGPDVIVAFGSAGPGASLPVAATPGALATLLPAAPVSARSAVARSVVALSTTPVDAPAPKARAAKVTSKGGAVPGGPARRPARPAVARGRPDRPGMTP